MQATVSHYQFDHFELDINRKKLVDIDIKKEIELGERQFKLLQILCEASPESVPKQALMDKLWPITEVSDWSLSRLISDTRQLLNDNGEQQNIIKTHRGIGFVISDVMRLSAGSVITEQIKTTKPIGLFITVGLIAMLFLSFLAFQQFQQKKLVQAMQSLAEYQDNSYTAFVAQAKRRNELVKMIEERLGIERTQQFEKFFASYYEQFTEEEAFVCSQMRAITDTGLMQNNRKIVETLEQHPRLFDELEQAKSLQQHLVFWLNKYHSVFKQRADMCLLYVGVEDGVPYPSGIDQKVKAWLTESN